MKKITKDDFENYKSISDLVISNSKKNAAFTVNKPSVEDNEYNKDVYSLELDSKKLTQITNNKKTSMLFWIDDAIIVKEDQSNSSNLYKINDAEKELLVELPKTVTNFKFDGVDTIYYLDVYDTNETKDEDCYRVIDEIPFWLDGFGYSNKKRKRLYAYSISESKTTAITSSLTEIHSFQVDKNRVVIVASTFEHKKNATQEILSYNLTTGDLITKLDSGKYSVATAGYIGDELVFMGTDMKKYGVKENPCFFKLDNGIASMVQFYDNAVVASISNDCKKGTGFTSIYSKDYLYFVSADGVENSLVTMSPSEGLISIDKELGTASCFDLIDDGFIVVTAMKNKLHEIYRYSNGQLEQLTSLNEAIYKERYIAPMEELWFDHLGIDMHAMILKPYGYEEGKKYPAILMIHGGPKSIYGKNFSHQMQFMASQGYYVFFTNPVGSCGRGNDFSNITGELGKLDYDIFMKFTDVVVDKYPIDKENLFVTGGSYGGFMTNWIVGHTNRFKAAVSQRSIANWFSKITSTDIGYFYNTDQMPGDPWSDPDLMWDRSPLKYANQVKTPTLFIHGEKDYRCGLIEAKQMFLALKYHDVDSRLVILNDSSHNAMTQGKPQTRLVWLEEMDNWFKKYQV